MLIAIQKSISLLANKTTALNLQRFFKTGKGDYGEGDVFLGLKAAQIKEVVKKYRELPLVDCIRLLHSKYHEHRMIALQILVSKYNRSESEALKQRIFNIFQRLHDKQTYSGTGIGLAICKKIVDNHHGVIYAVGDPNEGATFTVILPIA